jgi:hypothetical protein
VLIFGLKIIGDIGINLPGSTRPGIIDTVLGRYKGYRLAWPCLATSSSIFNYVESDLGRRNNPIIGIEENVENKKRVL